MPFSRGSWSRLGFDAPLFFCCLPSKTVSQPCLFPDFWKILLVRELVEPRRPLIQVDQQRCHLIFPSSERKLQWRPSGITRKTVRSKASFSRATEAVGCFWTIIAERHGLERRHGAVAGRSKNPGLVSRSNGNKFAIATKWRSSRSKSTTVVLRQSRSTAKSVSAEHIKQFLASPQLAAKRPCLEGRHEPVDCGWSDTGILFHINIEFASAAATT